MTKNQQILANLRKIAAVRMNNETLLQIIRATAAKKQA